MKKKLVLLGGLCCILLFCIPCCIAEYNLEFQGTRYQWGNWNTDNVINGPPPALPSFSLDKSVSVIYMDSYHWNDGKGTDSPGTISLIADDGTVYGPISMEGKVASGAPNAIWYVELNPGDLVLPPGSYMVRDSNSDTWAGNSKSDGAGFFGIKWESYASPSPTPGQISSPPEIENPLPTQAPSRDCTSGGYWQLTKGEIYSFLEDDTDPAGDNYLDYFDSKGGVNSDYSGKLYYSYKMVNKWDNTYGLFENTIQWNAPPSIMVPRKEVNVNFAYDALVSGNAPRAAGEFSINSGLIGNYPVATEAYTDCGSDFGIYLGGDKYPASLTGTKRIHWHGDDETISHTESNEMKDWVDKIRPGSPGKTGYLVFRLTNGPVIVYTYSWVPC